MQSSPRHLPPGLEIALTETGSPASRSFAAAMLAHPAGDGGKPVEVRVDDGEHAAGALVTALLLPRGDLLTAAGAFHPDTFGKAFGIHETAKWSAVPIELDCDSGPLGDMLRLAADLCGWGSGAPSSPGNRTWDEMAADYWENGGGLPLEGLADNYVGILEERNRTALAAEAKAARVLAEYAARGLDAPDAGTGDLLEDDAGEMAGHDPVRLPLG